MDKKQYDNIKKQIHRIIFIYHDKIGVYGTYILQMFLDDLTNKMYENNMKLSKEELLFMIKMLKKVYINQKAEDIDEELDKLYDLINNYLEE